MNSNEQTKILNVKSGYSHIALIILIVSAVLFLFGSTTANKLVSSLTALGTIIAIIIQYKAFMLQSQQIQEQNIAQKQQAETFQNKLKMLERSDFRNYLTNLEPALQRHAVMIGKFFDPEPSGHQKLEYSEQDIENTLLLMRNIPPKEIANFNESDQMNCINRMCTYVDRFRIISDRAKACDCSSEYKDLRYYTPYGQLHNACSRKLQSLPNHGITQSNHWIFNKTNKQWVRKKDDNAR